MTNMFQMMKQLKDLRRLQKEMESKTHEATSRDGLVSVTVRGDLALKSLRIDPQALDPAKAERLARTIMETTNAALEGMKRAAAADVAKLSGGLGGLSQMLGG